MEGQIASDIGVRQMDIIRERLNYLHDVDKLSWRKIALLDAYKGIPAGSLCSYAKDREPRNLEHRSILGLRQIVEIGGKKYELTEMV